MVSRKLSKTIIGKLIIVISVLILLLLVLIIWQKNYRTKTAVDNATTTNQVLSSIPELKSLINLPKAQNYLNQIDINSSSFNNSKLTEILRTF